MKPASSPIRVLAFMEAYVVNGAAKSLLNFCDSVRLAGDARVQIAIATFHRGEEIAGAAPNEFVASARARGIEVFAIRERRAFDPAVIGEMRQVAQGFAPDIIETNNVKSHFLVRMAGLHKRRAWVAVHHGYTATDYKIKLFNRLDRFSLPKADRVVLVCGAFREQLSANGVQVRQVNVIHNSAAVLESLPDVEFLRERHEIAPDTKVLVSIGRLSFEKGHSDLMSALARVKDRRPELKWKLLAVGSGPERERLEGQVRQTGLANQVVFAGQQSDVLPYLALADGMILPSHSEGSPHVVLEAMAAGVPIVATKVGGVPEILSDDSARLVPARDAEALCGAILELFARPDLAKARATVAQRVLERDFSHAAYREKMIALFESVRKAG